MRDLFAIELSRRRVQIAPMQENTPDSLPAKAENPDLDHVDCWVFDLDNTLYPVTKTLLRHIDQHMGGFVARYLGVDAEEAHRVQKQYFREYGLTLRGLMIHHGLDPARSTSTRSIPTPISASRSPPCRAARSSIPTHLSIMPNWCSTGSA